MTPHKHTGAVMNKKAELSLSMSMSCLNVTGEYKGEKFHWFMQFESDIKGFLGDLKIMDGDDEGELYKGYTCQALMDWSTFEDYKQVFDGPDPDFEKIA